MEGVIDFTDQFENTVVDETRVMASTVVALALAPLLRDKAGVLLDFDFKRADRLRVNAFLARHVKV